MGRVVVVDDDACGCDRIMLGLVRAPPGDVLGFELSPGGVRPAVVVVVAQYAAPQHLVFGDAQKMPTSQ